MWITLLEHTFSTINRDVAAQVRQLKAMLMSIFGAVVRFLRQEQELMAVDDRLHVMDCCTAGSCP